jgi:hypothetical protein
VLILRIKKVVVSELQSVLLSSNGPENILTSVSSNAEVKNKLCILLAYLFRVKEFTTGAILTAFVLRGPA